MTLSPPPEDVAIEVVRAVKSKKEIALSLTLRNVKLDTFSICNDIWSAIKRREGLKAATSLPHVQLSK